MNYKYKIVMSNEWCVWTSHSLLITHHDINIIILKVSNYILLGSLWLSGVPSSLGFSFATCGFFWCESGFGLLPLLPFSYHFFPSSLWIFTASRESHLFTLKFLRPGRFFLKSVLKIFKPFKLLHCKGFYYLKQEVLKSI
jgi:hypothetical protein